MLCKSGVLRRNGVLGISLACAMLLAACTIGSVGVSDPASPAPTASATTLPPFSHVFVIVLENEGADAILGNAAAPYINSLAAQYGVALRAYAITHPSLPNYIALTSGGTANLDGTDCSVDASVCHVSGNQTNIADEIEASGRTWAAYMESMPQPCGLDNTDLYAVRHNPFVYYDDIRDGSNDRCATHDLPYAAGRFQQALASGSVPDFVWITPNLCNDGHNACGGDPIAHSDAWLQQNVPPVLASAAFQHNGVLFITWDEGSDSAACCGLASGGGRVATLVISPLGKSMYQSSQSYSHYSLLRSIEDSWRLGELNNTNPATQPGTNAMDDFFTSP
jgi:hypothetical protein